MFLILSIYACQDNNPDHGQADIINDFEAAYASSLEDRNPDSALFLAKKVIILKDSIDRDELIFKAYTNAGLACERMGKSDSTGYFYGLALELAHKMEDLKTFAFALQMQANYELDRKEYRMAAQTFREASTNPNKQKLMPGFTTGLFMFQIPKGQLK